VLLGLWSSLVIGVVCNVYSCFYFVIGGAPCATITPLVAELAAAVAISVSSGADVQPIEVAASAMVSVALSSVLAGVGMLLMAHHKMGSIIQFVPTPVMAGFLAGNGWSLLSGSLHLTSGLEIKEWGHLKSEKVPAVIFGFSLGVILFVAKLSSRKRFPYVLPAVLSGAGVLVYIVIYIEKHSMSEARAAGWLLDVESTSEFWKGWEVAYSFGNVHWGSVIKPFHFFFIFVVNTMTVLLSAIGLESLFKSEADVDKELWANGVANTLAGATAGSPGLSKIGISIIHYDAGATSRLAGLFNNLTVGVVFFLGGPVLPFLPLPVLGSMVFVIGVGLMYEYLVLRWSTMPTVDYVIMWSVVVFIALSGCVIGCLVGLGMVAAQFIFEASQMNIIKQDFHGGSVRSSRQRTPEEDAILSSKGVGHIRGVVLEGHIFFGTAQMIAARAEQTRSQKEEEEEGGGGGGEGEEAPAGGGAFFFVVDLSSVSHLDSSAVGIFEKLKTNAEMWGVSVVLSGGSQHILSLLVHGKVISSADDDDPALYAMHFPKLDMAMAWCEDQLLLSLAATPSAEADSRLASIEEKLSGKDHAQALSRFVLLMAQCAGEEEDPLALLPLIETCMEVSEREESSKIAKGGEKGKAIYFVIAGSAQVSGSNTALSSGACFGLEAYMTHADYPSTLTASAGCVTATLSGNALEKLRTEDAVLAMSLQRIFMYILGQKVKNAESQGSIMQPTLPPPGVLLRGTLIGDAFSAASGSLISSPSEKKNGGKEAPDERPAWQERIGKKRS